VYLQPSSFLLGQWSFSLGVPSFDLEVPSFSLGVSSFDLEVPSFPLDSSSADLEVPSLFLDIPSFRHDISRVEVGVSRFEEHGIGGYSAAFHVYSRRLDICCFPSSIASWFSELYWLN